MAERRRRAPRKRVSRKSTIVQDTPRKDDRTETIERMQRRWEQGRRVRESWQHQYRLEQLYQRVLGVGSMMALEDDEIRINRFLPTLQTILPSIFFHAPTFRVIPSERKQTGDVILQRSQGEAVLKEIASREFNLENAVRLALIQSFFSMGVLKIIYDPKTIPNPRKGEPIYQTGPDGSPILDPTTQQRVPVMDPSTGNPATEPDEIVDDETYRFEWVNAETMLLPDQGPDMGRWTWIGEEVTMTLDEAKEDTRFPEEFRKVFVANGRPPQFGRQRQRLFEETEYDGDDYFTYVEIWDIRKRKYYCMADGQPFSRTDFIKEDDYPEGIEEHPYAILPGYFPIIGPEQCPWPLPMTYNWLSQEDEYQIARRQTIEGGKRTARKVAYDDGTFVDEEEARKALQSPLDMESVKVQDVQRPWQVIADPEVNAGRYQELAFLDRDWIRTTGQPGSRVGGPRAGSATEAGIAENAGQIRDSAEREKVNQWLSVAGQKMLQRVQATLTLGMWIRMRGLSDAELREFLGRVYGPEVAQQLLQSPPFVRAFKEQFGNEQVFELTREDLEFQARVRVVPGSSRLRTLESDRDQFLQAAQILGSFPALMQSRLLLKLFLQLFEIDDEALIDELQAASQRQIEIEQEKAGRNQGNNGQVGAAQGFMGSIAGGLLGG